MVQALRLFESAPAPLPAFLYPARPGSDSRESYRLKIAMARGGDPSNLSTGLYHAVQTLRQTAGRGGGAASLPEVEIHDWPKLSPTAATMIDMRHGPLPTQDEARWQLDFLGR